MKEIKYFDEYLFNVFSRKYKGAQDQIEDFYTEWASDLDLRELIDLADDFAVMKVCRAIGGQVCR